MIGTAVLTFVVAVMSALVPAVPIEPYLVGTAATTGHSAVLLGLAAGAGQTLGKVLMLLGVRGTVRSAVLRRFLDRRGRPRESRAGHPGDRRGLSGRLGGWLPGATAVLRRSSGALIRALDRPLVAVPVLLLSAAFGVPPLLLVVFYVGATRMPVTLFAVVCLVGRSARFVAIAFVPALADLG